MIDELLFFLVLEVRPNDLLEKRSIVEPKKQMKLVTGKPRVGVELCLAIERVPNCQVRQIRSGGDRRPTSCKASTTRRPTHKPAVAPIPDFPNPVVDPAKRSTHARSNEREALHPATWRVANRRSRHLSSDEVDRSLHHRRGIAGNNLQNGKPLDHVTRQASPRPLSSGRRFAITTPGSAKNS